MLPPSWKGEVQKTVEENAHRSEEKRQAEQAIEGATIAAALAAIEQKLETSNQQQRESESRQKRFDIFTALFVFATAFFTALSWWVFHGQLKEMRKVYDPIKETADATRAAIDLSTRAELISDDWNVSRVGPNESPVISFRISNTGPSHALILRATYDFVIASGLPDKFDAAGNLEGFPALIGGKAQSDPIIATGLPTISAEAWSAIQGGKGAIFLRATIFYQNEFGDLTELRTTGRYGLAVGPDGKRQLRFTFPDADLPVSAWTHNFEKLRRLNYTRTLDPSELEK